MKTLLIVEDDPLLRKEYKEKFGAEPKLKILLAEDGQIAIDILSHIKPDLLITGIHMPKIDGFRVLEHIKRKKYVFPKIMLTNMDDQKSRDRAQKLGVDLYLCKQDVTMKSLWEIISQRLGFSLVLPWKNSKGKIQKNHDNNFLKTPKRSYANKIVMIVESDPVLMNLYLKKIQEMNGVTIRVASEEEQAMQVLSSFQPDVLISGGFVTPQGQGFKLLKFIMKNGWQFPVIAIGREEVKEKALSHGVTEYVSVKDMTMKSLITSIQSCLSIASAPDAKWKKKS